MKTIITKPCEIIDFETVFIENPAISGNPAPKRVGRVERVDYTTDVYEDGVTYPLLSDSPRKHFHFPHNFPPCTDMKRNTPEKILHVLSDFR